MSEDGEGEEPEGAGQPRVGGGTGTLYTHNRSHKSMKDRLSGCP